MIRLPPRSTRLTHSFPTRRSSDLSMAQAKQVIAEQNLTPVWLKDKGQNYVEYNKADKRYRIWLEDQASVRSEEHTSELQSLMRISYAVFCLKKKKTNHNINKYSISITDTLVIYTYLNNTIM